MCTFFAFLSVIFFPWQFSILFATVFSFTEPLVLLAVGIFADTLYYTTSLHTVPFFTLYGAVGTIVAFVVRSRVRASIMGR